MKRKIMHQLQTFEQEELVTSSSDFQDIINAISKDIRNQHHHRQQRKQELKRLHETLDKLNQNSHFYEEQVEYYQQYIKACLESLGRGPTRARFKKHMVKYSALKLYKKRVILEIEGLPKHQF